MKPLMLSNPEGGGGARRLSISDEDEDDILARERLRVDMSRHGIDYAPTLAQIGRPRSSSSSQRDLLPSGEESISPNSSSSPLPPIVDPIEAAEKQLKQQEEEEETIRKQMKEGKPSGFTEPPPRRMNKLERRHSSRASSISYNHSSSSPSSSSIAINGSGLGLGIDSSSSPGSTSRSISPATTPGGEKTNPIEEEEEAEGQRWTAKALRRMSRGWSSPPVA